MPLTFEIGQTAKEFGELLRSNDAVSGYLAVKEKMEQDQEIMDLERRLNQKFEILFRRQQNGEILEREELDEYYALKLQVQNHPLIIARDDEMEKVQGFFAQVAKEISRALGVDYSSLAR